MNHAVDTLSMGRPDRATLALQIELLVARLHPRVTLERRRDERVAMPVLFRLTPLDTDRQPLESESVTVVGKNISRRGLSFFHERPLPHRRAFISLVDPAIGVFAADIDVTWCRFTKPGWYESGGRLLAAVAPQSSHNSGPLESVPQEPLAPQSPACISPTA